MTEIPDRLHPDAEILRHQQRVEPEQLASIDAELIEAVSSHLARHFGPDGTVLHEIVSDLVHVDIHVVPATVDRKWLTLVTSGMAERPMDAPPGAEDCRYAELLLALPADWPTDEASLKDERYWWPFRLLKQLARFPHEYRTWLWLGHSMPNGSSRGVRPGHRSRRLYARPTNPGPFRVLEAHGRQSRGVLLCCLPCPSGRNDLQAAAWVGGAVSETLQTRCD
jgi:hypothetical protein